MSVISADRRCATIHAGFKCQIKRYKYGTHNVDISHYDQGTIVCGVIEKRSGAFIGYIVGHDFMGQYVEEYVSKQDVVF